MQTNQPPQNLLVAVLGHRKSGKSYTWNTLFGRTVKTGTKERRLYFNSTEYTSVYLVSGSSEERQAYVGDLIKVKNPRIVLCSIQYVAHAMKTFNYFVDRGYSMYVHWLNPGWDDQGGYHDEHQLGPKILSMHSMLGKRSGKVDAEARVGEMRHYIYDWAKGKDLVHG
ncbi:hypothetical protein [Microscilla marina]|uniref:G domain-containing protein n=1 Tax=Microscilla marina ATCC 23134 TaxID=313606 RepID=A1ZTI3_MICM2|nr:hypothetical protein [Microscilla marina]EAY26243.1 hypothetical protein M23134_01565 [Microscilla marina ATCC 23134]